jgi:8-oxo-dGTP pyrophosphatase MutT (NUDIX family)
VVGSGNDTDDAAHGCVEGAVRRLGSRIVHETPWIRVRLDDVEWPDGTAGAFSVVEKPDFAVVLPRGEGGFWLVEQYRYPVGARSWELPMGTWPPGRQGDPLSLARAELAEETGLRAAHWRHLGAVRAAAGFSATLFHVYLATDLTQGEPAREPSEADMIHRFVTDAEVDAMIRGGQLADGPTLAAFCLYERLCGGTSGKTGEG